MKQSPFSLWVRSCLFYSVILALIVAPSAAWQSQASSGGAQQNAPLKSAIKPATNEGQRQARNATRRPGEIYTSALDIEKVTHTLAALEPVDPDRLEPNQIGVGRQVNLSSVEQGALFVNPDGGRVRILAIRSPGARAVRVRFNDFDLPPGDEVYVYSHSADGHTAGPYRSKGPSGSGEFWGDTLEGDTAIIEHHMRGPETAFTISQVSHVYAIRPQLLPCHKDATCGDEPEKDAVARILYARDGGGLFVCSGTMLNNRAGDFTPFFLTAGHCVSTPTEAQSVEVYWFYRTTGCDSGSVSDGWARSSGAELLATSRAADSTLLKLTAPVPDGARYSGWDPEPKPSRMAIISLSHPGGGLPPSDLSYLRRAEGVIDHAFASCSASGLVNGYGVSWNQGATEPGSSGSGIWVRKEGQNYLVGVASCGQRNTQGEPFCGALSFYGRFSDFYPLVQHLLDYGGSCLNPVIDGAAVEGKALRVSGQCFNNDADVLINGKKQKKTSIDSLNPGQALIAKKAGKKIQPGDKVQVRNPDGRLSGEFIYGQASGAVSRSAPHSF